MASLVYRRWIGALCYIHSVSNQYNATPQVPSQKRPLLYFICVNISVECSSSSISASSVFRC